MTEKLYYSMGEVTEMLDVSPSLIRYWGTQFDILRPHRNKKGNRMFTPADVDALKLIYHLLKEQKMTIAGAKKALRQRRSTDDELSRRMELLERLQQIRAILLEVREGMEADDVEEAVEPEEAATTQPEVEPVKPAKVEERPLPFYEQTLFDLDSL